MAVLPITINSGTLPRQPSRLHEYREYFQAERTAIDGGIQRDRVRTPANPNGYKYVVDMTFEDLDSTDWQAIDRLFVSGSGVRYYNPSSGRFGTLSFSGLPFPDEGGDYAAGDSLQSPYRVKIRQF